METARDHTRDDPRLAETGAAAGAAAGAAGKAAAGATAKAAGGAVASSSLAGQLAAPFVTKAATAAGAFPAGAPNRRCP